MMIWLIDSWRKDNKMKVQKIIVFLGLAVWLQAISLTISSLKERCMIVSSSSSEQYLKTDLRFTRFADQALEEGYRIVLHNTETHEEQAYQISEGTFRKEFQLTERTFVWISDVVYRFCFKVVLSRFREVRTIMQYHVDVTHRENFLESNVTVPAGLLRVQDLHTSYRHLISMQNIFEKVKNRTASVKQNEDLIFDQQKQKMQTLSLISIVEIIVVITFGAYQYWRLKTLIQNKQ